MQSLKPILQHDSCIINGMMRIKIANLDQLYRDDQGHEFTLGYKFNLPNEQEHYLNHIWQSTDFTIFSVTQHNDFAVKVPLFLLPYSLEYNLTIKVFGFSTTEMDNDNEDPPIEEIGHMSSINYIANIPSILMEPIFKRNDHIQYMLDYAAYVVSGTILEILDNDMIKIKTDQGYNDNLLKDIVILPISQVLRYPIPNAFVIDITNRTRAEIDLVLRTNNEESIEMYCELYNVLNVLFVDELLMEKFEEYKNFIHMSELVAINIHSFLYSSQYNYKIMCVFGDMSELILEEQWKYFLERNCNDIRKGFIVSAPQETRQGLGYTCDICRIEVNWYEYVFHCKCNGNGHDYCLSCIHSLITQYNRMKPFISLLLNDILNENCIDEIVSFCVGKAIKFNIQHEQNNINKNEHIMMVDININQKQNIIDDTKNVGSKRCMQNIIDTPRKRRRIQ